MTNKIEIEGVICGKEEPVLKTRDSGEASFRFSIQWTGKIGKREAKPFFKILLQDSMAKQFNDAKVWKRGQRVLIHGILNSWMWEEKKMKITEIVCTKITLLHPAGTAPKAAAPAPAATKAPEPAAQEEETLEI